MRFDLKICVLNTHACFDKIIVLGIYYKVKKILISIFFFKIKIRCSFERETMKLCSIKSHILFIIMCEE